MSQRVQFDAVEEIIRASACGRDILCLTGAGVSVDAGIPHLTKLTEYLAKVQCYITKGAFQPKRSENDKQPRFGNAYLDDPSRYVRDFGWPDPNQLNADLWQWIGQGFEGVPCDRRNYLDYLVRAERIGDLLRFEPGLDKAHLVEKLKTDQREGKVRFDKKEWEQSGLWHLRGNWKPLLAYLTHSNPDYADTLFQSLIRNRCPGMAHRFLAFLTPILGLRLFLTVNFDDLLEEALRVEGHDPVVYAVARDSPLPHPSLVRSQLSVIKLHGDAFRLRIGEDLDGPLDEDSKRRLDLYAGGRPLLLVLGVGGADRRVMDVVDLVAQKWKDEAAAAVYWLHFGTECPKVVKDLMQRSKPGAVCAVPTFSPASFLLEMFSRQTGAHPPSLRPYEPRMFRPIVPARSTTGGPGTDGAPPEENKRVWVFLDRENHFDFGASLDLARFVASKAETHTPIWVDLSAMHKYEDLVVEIIRQIRKYDRSVPPLTLPGGLAQNGKKEPKIDSALAKKAVQRIFEALCRDRYVLALNGVWSFGRPPSCHHWPRSDRHAGPGDAEREATDVFLRELVKEARSEDGPLQDSILALSVSSPDTKRLPVLLPVEPEGEPWKRKKGGLNKEARAWYADALLLLSTSRRRWSWVPLLELLPGYMPEGEASPDHVVKFLQQIETQYVLRCEGAEYWMCRGMRDGVYETGQKWTWPSEWPRLREIRVDAAPQLARLARIHADLGKYYYGHLYAASQEPYALLESLYHQISSLRYLTRLDAWLQFSPGEEQWSQGLRRWLASQSDNNGPLQVVRELRRQHLWALRRLFSREREVLLSLLCADTLLGWVDWIKTQDLPRFRIPDCLGDPEVEAAQPWHDYPVLESSVDALGEQLDELKADALRHKMDFQEGLRERFHQIGRLTKIEMKPTDPGAALQALVRDCDHWFPGKPSQDLLKLVRGLCDVWQCLRGMEKTRDTGELCLLFSRIVKEAADNFRLGAENDQWDLQAITIRWLRGAADHQLTAISPWSLRGAPEWERQKVLTSCQRAVEICEEALGTIEWAAGEDYARHVSYFHSYKGRALYLRAYLSPGAMRSDDFAAAHRELDRAQAGLLPRVGVNRESLAVSLLRLAECLMVRADTFLQSRDPLVDTTKALSSAARELDRATEVLGQAESMLIEARQNLEWWSCLYQLRAQLEVEHLLLQMSGYRSDNPEVSLLDARLPHTVQAGLRAIRQGLDVLLPIQCGKGHPRPYYRIERFLRMWI
ncbi:MAG TPA: SIR2 family protein [Thermoanaerobaculia bacterium]|nr:SIR2 family protein [Thermoanaerobaculia bacterium]